MATDELPLYASFEEEISRCVLCEQNSDEPINYGEKLCSHDITAHFYCMVNNFEFLKGVWYMSVYTVNCTLSVLQSILLNFYFQLLSSKLVQNGDDDEELKGFLIADIKQELKRSAKLVRVFFFF